MQYIAIHKPINVVSSTDSQNTASKNKLMASRRSIYELLKEGGYPHMGLVGRLDAMTSGVMLFTNDSKMQRLLLTPEEQEEDDKERNHLGLGSRKRKAPELDADEGRQGTEKAQEKEQGEDEEKGEERGAGKEYKVKEYILTVLGGPQRKWGTNWCDEARAALIEEMTAPLEFSNKGIKYYAKSAEVSILSRYRSEKHSHGGKGPVGADLGWVCSLKVVLREGKHHQIRRLAARSKLLVISLVRHTFAGGLLSLDDPTLKEPGSMRPLTEGEVAQLRKITGQSE